MIVTFKKGHKFDILDLFIIHPREVQTLFWKELHKKKLNEDNIEVFLDSGLVDLNAKDEDGFTALYYLRKHPKLAIYAIKLGAKLENEIKPRKEKDTDDVEINCPYCKSDDLDIEDEDFDDIEFIREYYCLDCDSSFSVVYSIYNHFDRIEGGR